MIWKPMFTMTMVAVTLSVVLSGQARAQNCESRIAEYERLRASYHQSIDAEKATNAQIRERQRRIKGTYAQYKNAQELTDKERLGVELDRSWPGLIDNWRYRAKLIRGSRDTYRQMCQKLEKLGRDVCLLSDTKECFAEVEHMSVRLAKAEKKARTFPKTWRPKNQQEQARRKDPTVTVVNRSGMKICWHPGGLSGGACGINPGGKRSFRLDKLRSSEGSRYFDTNQIVMVGGGHWAGSPYTTYKDMRLCASRTFTHKDGSVIWEIFDGIASGCGVRGYRQ